MNCRVVLTSKVCTNVMNVGYETDDLIEIDGHYYCEDCYFFCEYHQRYEVKSDVGYNYVQNYGYVCDYALYDAEKFI